jgi:V/A-type H+-transporting ATPase subunit A
MCGPDDPCRIEDNNGKKTMSEGKIQKVAGPLVVATDLTGAKMYEVVRVGEDRLFGEIIEVRQGKYSIQVYEETDGLGPGAPVYTTGQPLSVELGPGLMQAIYDGIQRPLAVLLGETGDFLSRGADLPALDRGKKWAFKPQVRDGQEVGPGDILGTVQETEIFVHKIMVPPGVRGRVIGFVEAEKSVEESIGAIETPEGKVEIRMLRTWPVRQGRPYAKRLPPEQSLVTGQRVVDMFFPLCKGGTACVPGPFGSGKTVVQHQLAKWSDVDVVVYVGCGERGNEMTDVLMEMPELKDPRTGRPLIERTVLVANTSNMPVAAREASIFTGITMAEYFRDMGYNVAIMADSSSRWAEAMREISGRLEEMPGEEGYPAYLASRIASFYERAGRVTCQGSDQREGTLSIIGAVSPPGGDLSDPVVQATLRVVKVFWGLDDALAAQRHFPAINWLTSYSLYLDASEKAAAKDVDPRWPDIRREAMGLLHREAELDELVRLVGVDALPASDRLTMLAAKMIREDFLHQNAFDDIDTYTSHKKQFLMLRNIIQFYRHAKKVFDAGAEVPEIASVSVLEKISRAKFIAEDKLEEFDGILKEAMRELDELAVGDRNAEESEEE